MIYEGKEFKPYDPYYYVSKDGDIYSAYKKGLLKHYIDHDGYHRVDIHGKHMKIHKLVYIVWTGSIPEGMQVNHMDDDKDHNHARNLYAGSQRENIKDCVENGHRAGHKKPVAVYDNEINEVLQFESIKELIAYTGHSVANGSLPRCLSKKWFTDRFEIIER